MRLPIEPPPVPRSPWQRFYGGVHRLRQRYYQSRAQRLPRPVISVGNLHWGGSGKTPMTAAIAAHLRDRGLFVAILSRGYGSRGKGVRLVSRGQGPLLGPGIGGDEPVLLAGMLPGVAVVVCGDRYLAGRHAMERLDRRPDVFLLDDGFSHLRLARDLDLLIFPAADPFAGGKLPPGGRLREPLRSSSRAHAVLLSGAEDQEDGQRLAKALRPHGFAGPGFRSITEAERARAFGPRPIAEGSRALVVSAIARPTVFLDTVRQQGFEIAADLAFKDHHRYDQSSLDKIRKTFTDSGAEVVITTGKDQVKLQGRLELPMAEISIVARPEDTFWRWLDQQVAELPKP